MKAQPLPADVSAPDPPAWDDLVQSSRGASVFHTSAWARLWTGLSRSARWEAAIVEEGGRYMGALGWIARRHGWFESLDAMPYGTYGGPIVRDGHPDVAGVRRALIETFLAHASRRRVLRAQLTWYGGRLEASGDPRLRRDPRMCSGWRTTTSVKPLLPSTRRLVRQADERAFDRAESADDLAAFLEIAVETIFLC
jgi:hypothetical protein